MDYIVQTRNLTKTFQGKEVVSNVNMNIKKGEIYGFLGPNGAGKTTIMKMLTNLIKPTSGEMEIFNEKVSHSSYDYLSRIGSIIEYPVFFDKLTARENLELHCEYMGFHQQGIVDKALEMVKLTDIENKSIKNFSLGMKQRLGIARAIITKPELLILDEPINGLDPLGIKEIRSLFHSLSKDYGMTLLISSHNLSEIEQIADTIGVIKKGSLIKEISMESLKGGTTEYIELVVSERSKACFILEDNLHISNFKTIDENKIRIFDQNISQADITKALVLQGIEIISINRKFTSLEEYFLDLVQTEKNIPDESSNVIKVGVEY